MSRFRAVVFDLDGTLVHSLPDIVWAANAVMRGQGLDAISEADIRRYVGDGLFMLMARCFAHHGAEPPDLDAAVAAFQVAYKAGGHGRTTLYPDVLGALEALRGRGLTLSICTNKHAAPAREIVAAKGLAPFIDGVVGGDTLSVRKPDPAPLVEAARLAGAGAANFAYVGDSEVDAEAAEAAGAPFFWFTGGYWRDGEREPAAAGRFAAFSDLPRVLVDGLGGVGG